MRVFPVEFLEDKITIGLNMAWKLFQPTFNITMRPDLNIPEFLDEPDPPELTWFTVERKLRTREQREFVWENADRFYHFDYEGQPNTMPPDQPSIAGRIPEWVREPNGDNLYLWTSISQSAVHLAANLGAQNVFLVGCDNCSLAGNHHAHAQHTLWKGADPDLRYQQYEEGLAEVRAGLRERGVRVMSLTPLLGLSHPERDFHRQCEELERAKLIENEDISDWERSQNPPHWTQKLPRPIRHWPTRLLRIIRRAA